MPKTAEEGGNSNCLRAYVEEVRYRNFIILNWCSFVCRPDTTFNFHNAHHKCHRVIDWMGRALKRAPGFIGSLLALPLLFTDEGRHKCRLGLQLYHA